MASCVSKTSTDCTQWEWKLECAVLDVNLSLGLQVRIEAHLVAGLTLLLGCIQLVPAPDGAPYSKTPLILCSRSWSSRAWTRVQSLISDSFQAPRSAASNEHWAILMTQGRILHCQLIKGLLIQAWCKALVPWRHIRFVYKPKAFPRQQCINMFLKPAVRVSILCTVLYTVLAGYDVITVVLFHRC